MGVAAMLRQQHGAHPPSERERGYDAQHRHEEGRQPDLQHVPHRGFEPDPEQQDEHTQLRQHIDARVGRDGPKPRDAEQMEIAEQDSGHQLAQHRRLPDARGQVAAELRAGEDHRQGQDYGRYVRWTHD